MSRCGHPWQLTSPRNPRRNELEHHATVGSPWPWPELKTGQISSIMSHKAEWRLETRKPINFVLLVPCQKCSAYLHICSPLKHPDPRHDANLHRIARWQKEVWGSLSAKKKLSWQCMASIDMGVSTQREAFPSCDELASGFGLNALWPSRNFNWI